MKVIAIGGDYQRHGLDNSALDRVGPAFDPGTDRCDRQTEIMRGIPQKVSGRFGRLPAAVEVEA